MCCVQELPDCSNPTNAPPKQSGRESEDECGAKNQKVIDDFCIVPDWNPDEVRATLPSAA